MLRRALASLGILAAAGTAAASGIKVGSTLDETYNVQDWKRFAFRPANRLPESPLGRNTEADQLVRRTLEAELRRAGFVPAGDSPADFVVSYDYIEPAAPVSRPDLHDDKRRPETPADLPRDRPAEELTLDRKEPELVVEFLLPDSAKAAWRGEARGVRVKATSQQGLEPGAKKLVARFLEVRRELAEKRPAAVAPEPRN